MYPKSDLENSRSPINLSNEALLDADLGQNYKLKIFKNTSNLIAHILIGATVGVSVFYSLRNGIPMNVTSMHILLCVIGYQLLMAESILSLSPDNTWTASLKLVHKRRIHWILQILGSGIAIAGSFIMSIEKSVNWNTLHGKFALVALVFTVVSFVNGLASLYAYELRRFIPSLLSKITHIVFGTVAFVAASISLCYGFDKGSFRNWLIPELAVTLIVFTAIFTFIIIINPFITFFQRLMSVRR